MAVSFPPRPTHPDHSTDEIIRLERRLGELQKHLNTACDTHEAAPTRVTADEMLLRVDLLAVCENRLVEARRVQNKKETE